MIKPEKGQWLFTCNMYPVQFSHFLPTDPKHYDQTYINSLTPEQLDAFIHDTFVTLEGGNHSARNCSMKLISESYAKWFIENKVWELFDKYVDREDRFVFYELEVKELCRAQGIEYEGI